MFDGKVVLITGASKGIGEALAYAFADFGAKVAICARRETALREVVEKPLAYLLSYQHHDHPHIT